METGVVSTLLLSRFFGGIYRSLLFFLLSQEGNFQIPPVSHRFHQRTTDRGLVASVILQPERSHIPPGAAMPPPGAQHKCTVVRWRLAWEPAPCAAVAVVRSSTTDAVLLDGPAWTLLTEISAHLRIFVMPGIPREQGFLLLES